MKVKVRGQTDDATEEMDFAENIVFQAPFVNRGIQAATPSGAASAYAMKPTKLSASR